MNMIEVKNVKKSYGDIVAVKNISFVVKKGEFFSFLGINGAGKSTTINMITGSLEMDEGEIIVNGFSVKENSFQTKSNIGVVFQTSGLDGALTVYDNLFYRGKLYNIESSVLKKRIAKLSQELEFKEYLYRPLKNLSGGQKRKIDLARALIHEPQIIILDEPTTGLDPKTRKLMWKYLNSLRKTKDLTIFLTTHYMEEANQSDYIVIIDEGNIITLGTPNELKEKYARDYLKIYKKDSNVSLKEYLDEHAYVYKEEKEYFIVYCEVSQAREFIICHPEWFEDFELYKGSMDDVFLNVTGKDIGE